MVDIQTTRDFKVENGVAIAIKRDEYTNGAGKKVVRTLEEHGITVAEMDEVINNLFQTEMNKLNEERTKLVEDRKQMQTEVDDALAGEEDKKSFAEFKEYVESEKFKKCSDLMEEAKTLAVGKSRIEHLDTLEKDIVAW